ncbi:ethionine resistance protein, partial [Linderina pennispora]
MTHGNHAETGALLNGVPELDHAALEYGTIDPLSPDLSESRGTANDLSPDTYTEWPHVRRELVWLIRAATPIVVSSMSQLFLMTPMLAAVGRLGTIALASMNLTSLFAGLGGITPLAGVAMALDTFCSQSYTGAKDKRILGVLLQRALLIGLVVATLIYPLWWYSGHVFKMFGVPDEVAHVTGKILRVYYIGIVLLIAYECLRSFLFAQGIRRFVLIAQPIGLVVGWSLIWLLIANPSTSIGIEGVAFVILGVALAFCTTTVIFIATVQGYQCWGGWSRASLHDWMPMVKLGAAGTIVSFLEALSIHVIDFGSMFISAQAMAAQAVLSMLMGSTWIMGIGFSVAVCNRVGNHLGSGLPNRAKLSVLTSFVLSALLFSMLAAVLVYNRTTLPPIFSSDGEVIDLLETHIPWTAAAGAIQGVNMALNGILRGQGRQSIIARIRFFSFVFIGVPVGSVAVWVLHWGLAGLWLGFNACLASALVFQICVILATDWDKEIIACQK